MNRIPVVPLDFHYLRSRVGTVNESYPFGGG